MTKKGIQVTRNLSSLRVDHDKLTGVWTLEGGNYIVRGQPWRSEIIHGSILICETKC